MNQSGIYNSYVNGTIGMEGRAAGGIMEEYESWKPDSGPHGGAVSREPTTAVLPGGNFYRGTRDSGPASPMEPSVTAAFPYLFTNTPAKGKAGFRSTLRR